MSNELQALIVKAREDMKLRPFTRPAAIEQGIAELIASVREQTYAQLCAMKELLAEQGRTNKQLAALLRQGERFDDRLIQTEEASVRQAQIARTAERASAASEEASKRASSAVRRGSAD